MFAGKDTPLPAFFEVEEIKPSPIPGNDVGNGPDTWRNAGPAQPPPKINPISMLRSTKR